MFSLFIHFYRRQLPICSFDYSTFIPYLPLKDKNLANVTPYIFYRFNDFSILYFCPFKLFCFSYKLLRSMTSLDCTILLVSCCNFFFCFSNFHFRITVFPYPLSVLKSALLANDLLLLSAIEKRSRKIICHALKSLRDIRIFLWYSGLPLLRKGLLEPSILGHILTDNPALQNYQTTEGEIPLY